MRAFFSAEGRLNRARFWQGTLALTGIGLCALIFSVFLTGAPQLLGQGKNQPLIVTAGLVAALLVLATVGLTAWAGICIGMKRYHDLDKPGVWVLIQFVPFIGGIWYLVEAGCIAGTTGPNLYGADPLHPALGTALPPDQMAARARAANARPGWVIPLMVAMALPGLLLLGGGLVEVGHTKTWLKRAIHVEGEVTALVPTKTDRADGAATTSYMPIYEARTAEGEPIKVVSLWAVKPAPAKGSTVDLVYEAGKPASAVANDWTIWFLPAFFIGWGTVWTGFWVFSIVLVALLWKRAPRAA